MVGPFCAISAGADCANNPMQDRHRLKPEAGNDMAYFALLSGNDPLQLLKRHWLNSVARGVFLVKESLCFC